MRVSLFERRKKVKTAIAALAVSLIVSGILAVILLYMSRAHPRL